MQKMALEIVVVVIEEMRGGCDFDVCAIDSRAPPTRPW